MRLLRLVISSGLVISIGLLSCYPYTHIVLYIYLVSSLMLINEFNSKVSISLHGIKARLLSCYPYTHLFFYIYFVSSLMLINEFNFRVSISLHGIRAKKILTLKSTILISHFPIKKTPSFPQLVPSHTLRHLPQPSPTIQQASNRCRNPLHTLHQVPQASNTCRRGLHILQYLLQVSKNCRRPSSTATGLQ